MTTDAARVATARRWFRTVGNTAITAPGVTVVATPEHADTWESNFVCADPGTAIEPVLASLSDHMTHTRWQVVYADALTEPALEGSLALLGFHADGLVIEMLAKTPVEPRHPVPVIEVRSIEGEPDRAAFDALVAVDHAEGFRTGGGSAGVNTGLLAAMHRRMASCHYSLILQGGVPVGYGLAVACPNGLGLIEHLFTLPDWRGRGIMSAFIADAVTRLRADGCDAVFLDAHADDRPKLLYAALGFAPASTARTWVREVPR